MNLVSSKRCNISKITVNDIDEAKELYTNKKGREFLGGIIPEDRAIKKLKSYCEDKENIYFVVRLKEDNSFIGIVYIDDYHDKILKEISYEFLPEYWNKGYGTEVLETVLEYCKKILNMSKIISETQEENYRSRHLLEKLGYIQRESIMRFGKMQVIYEKNLSDT